MTKTFSTALIFSLTFVGGAALIVPILAPGSQSTAASTTGCAILNFADIMCLATGVVPTLL